MYMHRLWNSRVFVCLLSQKITNPNENESIKYRNKFLFKQKVEYIKNLLKKNASL